MPEGAPGEREGFSPPPEVLERQYEARSFPANCPGYRWLPLRLEYALKCWRVLQQAGRTPLILSALGNVPLFSCRFPSWTSPVRVRSPALLMNHSIKDLDGSVLGESTPGLFRFSRPPRRSLRPRAVVARSLLVRLTVAQTLWERGFRLRTERQSGPQPRLRTQQGL